MTISDEHRAVAVDLVRSLQAAGHVAYFAGGCVRDELLGLEPLDFDIATSAVPAQIREIFPKARSVGEAFGVMLVHRSRHPYEVATFRAEGPYEDHRRPREITLTDARGDAMRRDFTINGIFQDPVSEEVIDFVNGRADLEAKVIRAIGDADDRLSEDHLRMLRGVRFAARFGFVLERETADAIRMHAAHLKGISRERIGEEIRAMMSESSYLQAASLIETLGLAPQVFLDDGKTAPLTHLAAVCTDDVWIRLAAWLLDRSAPSQSIDVGAVRTSLMLSNEATAIMQHSLAAMDAIETQWTTAKVAARKRMASGRYFSGGLSLMATRSPHEAQMISRDIESLREHGPLAPIPLLTGNDLLAGGFHPGPDVGKALEAVYDAQLEGRVTNRQEATAFVMARERSRQGGEGG